MGICWYCTWGWPKEVKDIYLKGEAVLGTDGMHYGPAHIVWEDENFENSSIQWCIDNAATYRGDMTDDQLAVSVGLLRELLEVPESVRCCQPAEFGEWDDPKDFPPPVGLQMHPRG